MAAKPTHRAKIAYEEGSYLLDGDVSHTLLAASTSLLTVKMYTVDGMQFTGELKGHRDPIRDVRFSKSDANTLLTVGEEGTVCLWDVRAARPNVLRIELDSPDVLNSGDLSCDGALLAVNDGSDVKVFDQRSLAQPLQHLEDHSEDVLRVRFHDTQPGILCSGGDDGLLVVADTTVGANEEGDATQWVFNFENSVAHISFDGKKVVAHTTFNSVAAGCLETGDTLFDHPRPADHLYAVNAVGGDMLWGINGEGYEQHCGLILRAPLGATGGFEAWPRLEGGHSDIVRFALRHPTAHDVIFTGGEDGYVCSWGGAQRSGHSTASRVGGSSPAKEAPAPPAPAATPAAQHKKRKATAKVKRDAPY